MEGDRVAVCNLHDSPFKSPYFPWVAKRTFTARGSEKGGPESVREGVCRAWEGRL